MKRNWDTIREILTALDEKGLEKPTLRLSDFPEGARAGASYHVELLLEAGLVHGQMSKSIGPGPYDFLATRLTWDGHELLDAIKNDTVWSRTKDSFKQKGISMTFDLVKTVALDFAKALLKGGLDV